MYPGFNKLSFFPKKGAIMLNDEELYKRISFLQNSIGAVPSPFDCFLVNRGLKTLALRMREHQANGIKVAIALVSNPRIERVIYPGLESHPQHELYKRQMKGLYIFHLINNL